jgi:hypothetical protein
MNKLPNEQGTLSMGMGLDRATSRGDRSQPYRSTVTQRIVMEREITDSNGITWTVFKPILGFPTMEKIRMRLRLISYSNERIA